MSTQTSTESSFRDIVITALEKARFEFIRYDETTYEDETCPTAYLAKRGRSRTFYAEVSHTGSVNGGTLKAALAQAKEFLG